jgi:GT2 family glycosyltransferase
MTVGLVLVTWNAEAFIARTLAAVAAQSRPPDRIVVIDNASTDGTWAALEAIAAEWSGPHRPRLVQAGANLGFAAANNRAVGMLADCELVALLNPDAVPEPGWLAALVAAAAAHPEAASFASRLMIDGRPGVLDGAGDVCHAGGLVWRHGHGQPLDRVPGALEARPVFAACAAAALYRSDDWRRAGGLDERFFCYVEDVDLGFRLQLAGRPCWYVPDAVAHHAGSASAGAGSAFAVYHGHRNLEWMLVKNLPARLAWRYLLLHLATWGAGFVHCARRGRAGAFARAKRDAMRGVPAAWRARRAVQASRRIPVAAVDALLDRSSLWRRFTTPWS